MGRALVVLLAMVLCAGCQLGGADPSTTAKTPTPPPSPEISFFHDALAPYGRWVDVPEYGTCWYPTDMPPGWRPYTTGRWICTDERGWLFMSAEKWGWACEHYGRWTFADSYGWIWVPGKVWAPAWVTWRTGADYIGWAPLPPTKNGSTEIDASRVKSADLPAYAFSFAPQPLFTASKLAENLEPATRSITLLGLTQDATPLETVDGRLVNRGVDVAALENSTGKAVPRYHIDDLDRPGPAELHGQDVAVYRASISPENAAAGAGGAAADSPKRNSEQMAEERSALDEYQQQERDAMQQRHERELASPPAGTTAEQLQSRQALEVTEFDQQRQREIEAMRRRQRDERLAATVKAKPAGTAPPPTHYDLPPEWQLPPGMMPASPAPSGGSSHRP